MSVTIMPNSETKDSEMSILMIKDKLLVAFHRMSHLGRFERISGVKIYLSYLISTQKTQVKSVAELQALLYRLSETISKNNESTKRFTARADSASTGREHFIDYLALSDRALDIAVNSIIDKLLGVIFEGHKTSRQNKLMYKMLHCIGWADYIYSSHRYESIIKYHKKGLFASDCKKLFLKELMKNEP